MNLPDWAIWWAGGVIVAAGLVLLAWGWRGDRARGRRRCPKCWQEPGDIPGLRCPECGREARDERALGRTRRRRWAVGLGGLVVLGVLGGAAGYRVYHFGVWGLAPDTLLVYTAELSDMEGGLIGPPCCGSMGELQRRLLRRTGDGGMRPALAGWQWRALGRRFADQIDHHEMHPSQLAFAGIYLAHDETAMQALAAIARSRQSAPRWRALGAIGLAATGADVALSPEELVRLVEVVQRDANDTWANRIAALELAQQAHADALPIDERRALLAWSAREDPLMHVRIMAIKALATVGGGDGAEELDLAAAALEEIDDPSLLLLLHQAIAPRVLGTSSGERRDALCQQVRSKMFELKEAARDDPGPQ